MVLQLGDDYLVSGRHLQLSCAIVAQNVGNLVQRLGGVLRENDLRIVRTDERGDRRAGILVRIRGLLGQLICTAVHGRVVLRQEVPFCVEDVDRALGGRSGVQVDQGAAISDCAGQDGEILPDRSGVQ